MLVTVVILTKNAERFLGDTLPVIFNQQTDFDYDVLVIDSGSKDRTLEILSSYPLRVIRIPPETFDHGDTRNLGVREAGPNSKFVALLSQDANPFNAKWLQNLIQPMRDDPLVAGVFSRHVPRPEASASVVRQLLTGIQAGGQERLVKKMPDSLAAFQKNRFWYNFFSNTSSAIRRSVWEEFPFEKTDFAEDALWADQIIRNGYTIVFEPASIVVHSHNYSISEQFRQNVDHAHAMNKLFKPENFQQSSYWLRLFAAIPYQAIKDSLFVIQSEYFNGRTVSNKASMMLISLPWQTATACGIWVGAKLQAMPPWLKPMLSRQTRIKNQ